ncbi:TIM-barrel domain-containing protein [Aurantibacter sp.]|uniref:TIM-barrel domain-containing protein n=1 Tax=Aurantibacter sp. TaxID=2807103 RepID=UPI00326645B0
MKKKVLKVLVWSIGVLFIVSYFYWFLPIWGMPFNSQRHGNPPLTPAWALECWLWEDDVNNSEIVDELLAGYKAHDIPVRTIVLDSPWSLRYNDFEVDTLLYKKPDKWFKNLENEGYRVVLWMTSMVDSYSKDTRIKHDSVWYQDAMKKGYLAKSKSANTWWKGKGGFIDYSNPEAMRWWRSMQQNIFDLGIDGWKLDGTATLFWSDVLGIPFFYKNTADGLMSARTYMNHYYRDEYEHGLTQNPEFITLSRSIDRGYHPEGFAPIDASPVNWVGDQEHKWVTDEMLAEENDKVDIALDGIQGFESAIENILESAELGYNIVGSDVAGFSGKTIPPRLYIRWAQFSTFCGLFLNGGHGERRLWKRSQEELEIIRKFSWLHTELVPYMYHYVVTAHDGGRRLQSPLKKGKYHYMFGDDFLIAPIYKDTKNRVVSLPEGQWRYFFDDKELMDGGSTFTKEFPIDEFPVFVKEGAIIPLAVKRDYTGFGNRASDGFLTVLIYPNTSNSFIYYDTLTREQTIISYQKNRKELKINISGNKVGHILKIYSETVPQKIILDQQELNQKQWNYDHILNKISVVSNLKYSKGNYTIKY